MVRKKIILYNKFEFSTKAKVLNYLITNPLSPQNNFVNNINNKENENLYQKTHNPPASVQRSYKYKNCYILNNLNNYKPNVIMGNQTKTNKYNNNTNKNKEILIDNYENNNSNNNSKKANGGSLYNNNSNSNNSLIQSSSINCINSITFNINNNFNNCYNNNYKENNIQTNTVKFGGFNGANGLGGLNNKSLSNLNELSNFTSRDKIL